MIDDHGKHAADAMAYAKYANDLLNPPKISETGNICWPPVSDQAAAEYKLREELKRAMYQIPVPQMIITHKPLAELATVDLVMEMLKRGFAVMKLPEDGGIPEVLK